MDEDIERRLGNVQRIQSELGEGPLGKRPTPVIVTPEGLLAEYRGDLE
jgi:hypothetical protein